MPIDVHLRRRGTNLQKFQQLVVAGRGHVILLGADAGIVSHMLCPTENRADRIARVDRLSFERLHIDERILRNMREKCVSREEA
jgi:hypothetical protein